MAEISFNPLSLTAYFVSPRFNDLGLSTATGFFVIRNNRYFLITNWHVVSGRNSETGQCLSNTCAIPDNLLVKLHQEEDIFELEDYQVPLFDDSGQKKWLEHPIYGSRVDVVAIEMDIPSHLSAIDIEGFIEPFNENTNESVSDDVFIIGYPFGITVGHIFPIWKRASVASEPCINIDDLPKMLVDTASRSGMSGSPVILYKKRSLGIANKSPNKPGAKFSRNLMKLVGIYSGRIGANDTNMQAQLGVVWKSSVINEIIEQKVIQTVE